MTMWLRMWAASPKQRIVEQHQWCVADDASTTAGAPGQGRAPPTQGTPHPPAREKLFHQGPFPIRRVFFCFWPLTHWSCC